MPRLLSPKLSELFLDETGQFLRLEEQEKADLLREIQNLESNSKS